MNSITLANFSLIWNFNDNSVKFRVDIGPLDLLFAQNHRLFAGVSTKRGK
ncbi:hypothetical protein [Pectobacterium brasiliense]|nr:hypothetical protein [Pectobacterium brasiliense]MBN3121884.1 hypothetical protein [Pectobacterium brasiliense]